MRSRLVSLSELWKLSLAMLLTVAGPEAWICFARILKLHFECEQHEHLRLLKAYE